MYSIQWGQIYSSTYSASLAASVGIPVGKCSYEDKCVQYQQSYSMSYMQHTKRVHHICGCTTYVHTHAHTHAYQQSLQSLLRICPILPVSLHDIFFISHSSHFVLLNKLLSHAPMQKSCKGNIVMLSCSKVRVSIACFAWGRAII